MAVQDDDKSKNRESRYVYNKIGGNWIDNGDIVPDYVAADDEFGCSVSILGITALFGDPAPRAEEENGGSAYVVDICVP